MKLLIGNFALSFEQSKTQMALWAILAAPLLMSNKLSTVQPEFKKILQNIEIIRVNQDKLGIQGKRIYMVVYNTTLIQKLIFIILQKNNNNKCNKT